MGEKRKNKAQQAAGFRPDVSNKFLYALVALALLAGLFSAYFHLMKPLKIEEFDTRYYVRDGVMGFDLNKSAITFGNIPRGSGGLREVNFSNNYPFDIKVLTFVTSDIAEQVYAPQGMIIATGNVVAMPISVSVEENATIKNYTGKIKFEVYKCGSWALKLRGLDC